MPIHITLATDHEEEYATQALLIALLDEYDLSAWQFTDEVHIKRGAKPRSHPLLTLNTIHIDDPDTLLATYNHEQLHWYLDGHRDATLAATDTFQAMYPDAPIGAPEGGPDRATTYLHLVVNYLEYISLIDIIGPSRARAVMLGHCETLYTWAYGTVLDDFEQVGEVIIEHGLHPDD